MKESKFVKLIDRAFISFCLFLLLYAWINFYIRDLLSTFIISLILTSSITFIIFLHLNNKVKSKSNLAAVQIDIDKNFLAFSLLPENKKANLIKTILDREYMTKIEKNKVYYNLDNKRICISFLNKDIENQNDLIYAINELTLSGIDKICLVTNIINKNVETQLLNNIEIEIIDKTKLYTDYFLKYQIYPDKTNLIEKNDKINLAKILSNILDERRAKNYFFVGLILVFSSIIIPFRTYYLICASIFLCLAIACKIIPLFRQHKSL